MKLEIVAKNYRASDKLEQILSAKTKKLDKYFPPHYSAKQREDVIIQLLEQWSKEQAE